MPDLEAVYRSLVSVNNLANLTNEGALEFIGELIDLSLDLQRIDGLKHAVALADQLRQRPDLTPGQLAISHYFLANAWGNQRALLRSGRDHSWVWQEEEAEKELIHLRTALNKDGFRELPDLRKCQILTNLGNVMDYVGRFAEAIEHWDRALAKQPLFPMARGNRGYGLSYYAQALYDKGHAVVFLEHASSDLKTALSSELHDDARRTFEERLDWTESVLSRLSSGKDVNMHSFSLGRSKQETRYRRWCLGNRLFLNPLNDLGAYPISARDVLAAPNIVTGIDEGPYYHGYFDSMKQELTSARYLYYEGTVASRPHFADRGVLLYNTLDYPSYSLAVERVKSAFKTVYSLFDKIAYFLNHYLRLSIPEKGVSFRTFWYTDQKRKEGLRQEFERSENWPLRGLFWLSKDLFENQPGFREAIEPDARELSEIRNHLEHKYLKVHDDVWSGQRSPGLTDPLALHVRRRDFEAKTLKLIKMARASLIYLSLAVHGEERDRAKQRDHAHVVPGIPLEIWKDEWKT